MNIHEEQEFIEKIRTLDLVQLNFLIANPSRSDKDWGDKLRLLEIERDRQMKSLHYLGRRVYE